MYSISAIPLVSRCYNKGHPFRKIMSWYLEEQQPVYLDYNATTPLASEVEKSIVDSLRLWGNPSSNNPNSILARNAISEARGFLASLVNVLPDAVIFTSGGTESNNWIIHHNINDFKRKFPDRKPHIITSEIDHPSIIEPLKALAAENKIDVTFIRVEPNTGQIDTCQLCSSITANTCLVTIMLANNETGVLQPMECIVKVVQRHSESIGREIFIHTDAAQAIGKIPVNFKDLKVHAITVVGHKFYGPRIGALIVRNRLTVDIQPWMHGGSQEMGLRPGTENTPMIVALGVAAKIAYHHLDEISQKLQDIRDYFEERLDDHLGESFVVNFQNSPRLPNTSSVTFPTLPFTSCDLLEKCKSFYASTGAACHTGEISKILLSCGFSEAHASKTVRFSFGRETTREEVDRVIKEIKAMVFFSKHGGSLMKAMGAGPIAGF